MESALANLTSSIEKLSLRLKSVEEKLAQGPPAAAAPAGAAAPAAAAPAAAAPAADEVSPAQKEFDELVETYLKANLEAAKAVSPLLFDCCNQFIELCAEESRIIAAAAKSKKPTMDVFSASCKKIVEMCGPISNLKDKHRTVKEFNHIAAISEAGGCLGWIFVEPAPAPFMNDTIPGVEFYTNRVMKDTRGKDEAQYKWAKDFAGFLREVQKYVKKVHTTGLAFNPKGGDFAAAMNAAAPAPKAAAPAPAAAPKPAAAPAKPAGAPDTKGLFSALQQGTGITGGLKHVSNDMKTKNRTAEERATGNLVPKEKKAPVASAAPKKTVKPPSIQHIGTKWMIDYQVEGVINIDDAKINDVIYIGGCKTCTIVIKGKVNAITVDGCTKVGVVVDNVVSVVEIINSTSSQMQITGKAPSVNIDKCTGVQLHVSADAIDAEDPTKIFTSKSSGVNVLIPGATPEDDEVELPIAEQFLTVVKGGKLNTEIASLGI